MSTKSSCRKGGGGAKMSSCRRGGAGAEMSSCEPNMAQSRLEEEGEPP